MAKNEKTFKSVFGNSGNVADISLDWQCEKCGKDLTFLLVIVDIKDFDWQAHCCNETYIITPYVAAYNKEPKAK